MGGGAREERSGREHLPRPLLWAVYGGVYSGVPKGSRRSASGHGRGRTGPAAIFGFGASLAMSGGRCVEPAKCISGRAHYLFCLNYNGSLRHSRGGRIRAYTVAAGVTEYNVPGFVYAGLRPLGGQAVDRDLAAFTIPTLLTLSKSKVISRLARQCRQARPAGEGGPG